MASTLRDLKGASRSEVSIIGCFERRHQPRKGRQIRPSSDILDVEIKDEKRNTVKMES